MKPFWRNMPNAEPYGRRTPEGEDAIPQHEEELRDAHLIDGRAHGLTPLGMNLFIWQRAWLPWGLQFMMEAPRARGAKPKKLNVSMMLQDGPSARWGTDARGGR